MQLLDVQMRKTLTLYLSTIGNLTGPSLDLLKFGKLSKCGIKGRPLQQKQKRLLVFNVFA